MRARPRRTAIAIGLLIAVAAVLAIVIIHPSGRRRSRPPAARVAATKPAEVRPAAAPHPRPRPRPVAAPRHVTVHTAALRLTDPARMVTVGGRVGPRSFHTIIRYPVGLPGPFPLIVFGHGYNVTPAPYHDLLDAWARAGYVVAAPIFPLENANAPGGPNENDLPNQPEDMSLVISSLTRPPTPDAARIAGLVNPSEIAVAGQSDGGDTALAAAYDPTVRDTRIKAAVILSGAQDPFAHPFVMPRDGPPLLAIQGTADTINPPDMTYAFYNQAAPPKYLLRLIGAGHQPPYTEPGSELTIVEHTTLAFLNRYLKGRSRALPRYMAARSAGPGSVLTFDG